MTARSDNSASSPAHYDAAARGLHWAMALLIAVACLLGLCDDLFPESWKYGVVAVHKAIGVGVILLLVVRVIWRQTHQPPAPVESHPTLARLAQLGHASLYLLMFIVPMAGIAATILRGRGFDFGLFAIPPLMEGSREAAAPFREMHEIMAFAMIGLVGVHVVAALWHHLIRKDGIMLRMMPAK